MDKALLVFGSVAIAGVLSMILSRRRAAPTAGTHHIPAQLDLDDFPGARGNWLLVVFSSAKCKTCAGIIVELEAMSRPGLITCEVEIEREHALHTRYQIDAVPTTVIADPDGRVRKSFLGPVNRERMENSLAEAIATPGSGDL